MRHRNRSVLTNSITALAFAFAVGCGKNNNNNQNPGGGGPDGGNPDGGALGSGALTSSSPAVVGSDTTFGFPTDAAPSNLTNQLGAMLGEWTGSRWIVAVSQAEGAPTLAEAEARRESVLRNEVASHPLVRAVLETFPGAMIAAVRERFVTADAGTEAAADEFGDDVGDDGAATEEDGS